MIKKMTFQKKIFLSFSLILFAVLFTCGYIFIQYNISILKSNIETSSMDSLHAISRQFDDDLDSMEQTLRAIHASSEFTNIAFYIPEGDVNYFVQHPLEASLTHSTLISHLTTKDMNSTLNYISQYNDFLQVSNTGQRSRTLSKSIISNLPEVREGLTTKDYYFCRPPHANPWSPTGEYVYSVFRPIRDTFQTYGILEYQKKVTDFEEVIDDATMTDILQLSILDPETNTIYQFKDTEAGAQPSRIKSQVQSEEGFTYVTSKNLLCYTSSAMTGWKIIIERDISSQLSDIQQFFWIIVFSYLLGLLILLLFLYMLTQNLTRPLRELKDNLSVLEMDQEIVLPVAADNNEVSILTVAIEEILNKLRQQGIQLNNSRKRALKAHFEAMEAQINPHFLYNTLSVIGACGMESGNRVVPKMCTELSNLLRYSISYTYKTVTLENEIQNIRSYLYIMKMRYEHMLECTWNLDTSIYDVPIPKLILQPIVENCFQHGFVNTAPPWHVIVTTRRDETNWYVTIANNGNPFPQEQIDCLQRNFDLYKSNLKDEAEDDFSNEKMGFGLENTIFRLYIYYENNEYFHIGTDENGYTLIEIGGTLNE